MNKYQIKALVHGLVVLLFINCVHAGERLYVSPGGDDKNTGSKSRPLATLNGARDKIRELRITKQITDTIFVEIQSGTYYMTEAFSLTAESLGSPQSPVVFSGSKDDRPLISGGRETDRFQEVKPGLWRVYIPEVDRYGFYFEQLFVNGQRRSRARTPNRGGFSKVKRVEEVILDTSGFSNNDFAAQKLVVFSENLSELNDIDPKEHDDVLSIFYHKWDVSRKRVKHIKPADSTLYFIGKSMQPWNKIDTHSLFFIENYRKALDSPGEWFLQRDGYLYYIPLPGETVENTRCVYPVAEKLLTITGHEGKEVSSIRFENLRFEVTAHRTRPNGDEPLQAASQEEAAVMVDYAKGIELINCDIAHTGQYAVWFRKSCSESRVEQCHLYDLGGGGVKIGDYASNGFKRVGSQETAETHHITVHNNIIQHGGQVFPSAVGVIIFHGSDNVISHNDIADFRYSGVSVGWEWGYAASPSKRNNVEFNHIHHLGWGELSDMGGVYTLGASEGTTVSNNVIHHIHSFRYGGWGLYTDEGTYGVTLENNLVYKCKDAGFHQHYGKENVIRNNIFAFNRNSQIQLTRIEEHLSFSFTNNIVLYDSGVLYMNMGKDAWQKARTVLDKNCFWDLRTPTPDFLGMVFSDWKKLGKDENSIISDPLFVDAKGFDFRLSSVRTVRKIDFKPFDYTRAGVYGDQAWREKAILPDELIEQFDLAMEREK